MRRVPIFLGLAAVLSGGLVLFKVLSNENGTLELPAASIAASKPEVGLNEDEPIDRTTVEPLRAMSDTGTRTAIEIESKAQDVDPCAKIQAEYQATEAERLELAREQSRLKAHVAALELELQLLKHDENTPLGAFFRSDEAKGMSPEMRKQFGEYMQLEFPVFLRPGEATWIADRIQNKDWRSFGKDDTEVLIHYLGSKRYLADAPASWFAEKKQWIDDQEWLALFGTPKPD